MPSAFVEIPRRLIKQSSLPAVPNLHPEVRQWLTDNNIKARFHRVSKRLWFDTESQAVHFKINIGRWDHIKDPLQFEISSVTIQAKSRVLRGTWTMERPKVYDMVTNKIIKP